MRSRQDTHITDPLPGQRIAKIIARSGFCSRRDAEKLITDGRVFLNGKRIDSPAVNVTAEDKIRVDGKLISAPAQVQLWRYNKPKGRVTTHKDPQNRPTVFEALPPEMPRVISVGRLDLNTEGLLLLTNDGDLARHLEAPSTAWLRRYRVRAHGRISENALETIRNGIELDGIRYGPVEAAIDRTQGANIWLTLGLREGKNREVRKIMEHLGLTVNRLIRVSFGPFQLGELQTGAVDEIKRRVIAEQLGATLARKLGLTDRRGRGGDAAPAKETVGVAEKARPSRRPPQRRKARKPAAK